MGFIEIFFSKVGYAAVIPFFLVFFKTGIDAFNMTGVEKAILTESKKLSIHFSHVTILSIFFSVLLFVMWISDQSNYFKKLNFSELLTNLLASFIVALFFSTVIYVVVFFFIHTFSLKINYNFKEPLTNIEWRIVRRVDKNKLLVLQNNGFRKFINVEEIVNKEIDMELDEKKLKRKHWIYRSNKVVDRIRVIINVIILVVCYFTNNVGLQIILYSICYLSILHFFVVTNNDKIWEIHKKRLVAKDSGKNRVTKIVT